MAFILLNEASVKLLFTAISAANSIIPLFPMLEAILPNTKD
jgi:hypothetical protein